MNPNQNPVWAPPISILGVPFDNVTTQQTLSIFQDMIASRKPHYVATANVDFVVQATHDIELRRILNDAHLVLCDGMPLVWASHLLGNPLPERVAGSDLVPLLLAQAEKLGHRVFFLGGQEDIAAKAIANIKERHPDLQIAGVMSPPFSALLEMDHAAICKAVRDSKADILLVSFGCPKQEKWIAMNYRSLGVPVCMGVGATIDFLAGAVKRAPKWMQQAGMEWIFRLAQEPRRLLNRYFTDMLVFGAGILRQILRLSGSCHYGNAKLSFETIGGIQVVELPQRFDADTIRANPEEWQQIVANDKSTVMLGHRVNFADSTAIAMLSRIAKDLRVQGHFMVVAEPSMPMWHALEVMHVGSVTDVCARLTEATKMIQKRKSEETVSLSGQGDATPSVINWQGEVTAGNATEIWDQTEQLLAASVQRGCRNLTIDLSTVRFVDSTGVGLMVRAKKQCTARGINIRFEHPSQAASSVIRTLRMESFLLDNSPVLTA
jgi:exopolysaccharide biosynthesis WecB/TagA/CpsF family protein/anti-anti-sigma factor